jgi:hypothetical protein
MGVNVNWTPVIGSTTARIGEFDASKETISCHSLVRQFVIGVFTSARFLHSLLRKHVGFMAIPVCWRQAFQVKFRLHVTGDLTVRDITREIIFQVTVTPVSETRLEGVAKATVLRPDCDLSIPSVPNVPTCLTGCEWRSSL